MKRTTYDAKIVGYNVNGYPQLRIPLSSKITKNMGIVKGTHVKVTVSIVEDKT